MRKCDMSIKFLLKKNIFFQKKNCFQNLIFVIFHFFPHLRVFWAGPCTTATAGRILVQGVTPSRIPARHHTLISVTIMYDMFKFLFFQSWPCCSRLYIGMVSFRLWFSQIELRAPPWVEPLAQFELYIFSTLRFFWTFFHFANIFLGGCVGLWRHLWRDGTGGLSTTFNCIQPLSTSQPACLTDWRLVSDYM